MDVQIRRIDETVPLPEYKTPGAVAMDCYVRENVTILPQTIGYVGLNFALKIPTGYFILMAPRSSLHKRGLMLPNSVGIFDEDFSGDNDEYKVALYNFSQETVEVKLGDRLTQIMLIPYEKIQLQEVDTLGESGRGGFGTTGL